MKTKSFKDFNRRGFIKTSATAVVGIGLIPSISGFGSKSRLMARE